MKAKIFIFGCARSGTTLLLNLFRCFDDTRVVDRQHTIEEFGDFFDGTTHVVLKRTATCAIDLKSKVLADGDVWVVDIHRDPRDVVTSIYFEKEGYYTDFSRWERDVQAIEELAQVYPRVVRVTYEDLILQPRAVQERIATQIGLTHRCTFDAFTDVLKEGDISPASAATMGGIRPLDRRNVGRWKRKPEDVRRAVEQAAAFPQMLTYLVAYGYERDGDWVEQYS